VGVKCITDKITFDLTIGFGQEGGTPLLYRFQLKIGKCPEVYEPDDDTLLLLRCLEVRRGQRVLEMGCGTGFLSLHIALEGAEVTCADSNPLAVECARENAERNGLEIRVVLSDLFSEIEERYDLIVFNPPYLPVSDEGALAAAWSGGEGGLEVLEEFLNRAPRFLSPGGRMVVIVSSLMDPGRLEKILGPFEVQSLGQESLFFERLEALMLVHRS
jgi:release factor glutamine methyltransferase